MKKYICALLAVACTVQAQNNPSVFPTDARIKKVLFQENNVVPINGVTFTTTQIQFGDNERVLDIEGGDSTAWMVTYHPELSNMLFIKPTILDSNTNMTVITNQHTYYFHLSSNKKVEHNAAPQTYALKFMYPTPVVNKSKINPQTQARQQTTTLPTPKVVNTAYRFSGSPELVPLHVFDDGQFTYFELSIQGAVPAIFAVDDKSGKEST
ncbi:MAG: TrbG/VirB9 family P-type conjugative transfer protein, partial [Legionellaceae bacterium]|nr:TrbG/VirB9 family P-type conjugative transfer protein [Legionellaceae bacterium]